MLDAAGLGAVCLPAWAISLTMASPVNSNLGGVCKLVHIDGQQVADDLITLQNVLEITNSKRTLIFDNQVKAGATASKSGFSGLNHKLSANQNT